MRSSALKRILASIALIGAAGRFLYGTVTLEDVMKLLDANIESGALRLK